MRPDRIDIEIESHDRAMIIPTVSFIIELGFGLHLRFSERAPLGKVEAFVRAFNDLQKAIQEIEGAGRD
jgi:hypothetical protein